MNPRVTERNSMNEYVHIQHTQEVWHKKNQSCHCPAVVFKQWYWFKTWEIFFAFLMLKTLIQSLTLLCKTSDQNTEPRFHFSSLTLGLYLSVVTRVHNSSQYSSSKALIVHTG